MISLNNNKNKIGIIIFIDQRMTHLVSVFNNNLLSSSEVPIGLDSFVEIIKDKKSNLDLINQTNITGAIHYLERVGIFHFSEKKKKSNNLNNRDTALNDLSGRLVDQIMRFISDLKLYDEANKIIPNTINKIYIGGVGSHIKGLDEKINRALNFKIDSNIHVGEVVKAMKSANQSILQDVIPVDIYQSKKDSSTKDVLFSLSFQSPKKTLEDKDVNAIITEIINIVSKKFNAKLREN